MRESLKYISKFKLHCHLMLLRAASNCLMQLMHQEASPLQEVGRGDDLAYYIKLNFAIRAPPS